MWFRWECQSFNDQLKGLTDGRWRNYHIMIFFCILYVLSCDKNLWSSKLSRELLKRKLPGVYVRLLVIVYTNMSLKNGVRCGGIVSPLLFYTHGLLCMLRESRVGCSICNNNNVFVCALADDIALLAPTRRAMRHLLCICEECGKRFSILFNAAKSAWLYVITDKQSYEFERQVKDIVCGAR